MSPGSVDCVWAVFHAFRDHRVFEMLELLHPDVVWVRADGSQFCRHEGIRQMIGEVQRETGGYSVQLEDVVADAEPGVVLAKGQVIPSGNRYGIEMIWRVRFLGGLVKSVEPASDTAVG